MSDEYEFEEIEQIPWAALAAKAPNTWPRIAVAVGALALAAAVILLVFVMRPEPTAVPLQIAASEPVAAAGGEPAPTEMAIEPVASPPPTALTEAAVFSEADLMAISVDDESHLAIMRAEWFVRDYFTVDGDEDVAAQLRELLGETEIPHHDPAGYSYVEWARAFAILTPDPGRYAVDVAYRTMVAADGVTFSRNPVRAVTVTLDIDVDGTARLVDLPTPADIPGTKPMTQPAGMSATPPDALVAEAGRSLPGRGTTSSVIEAHRLRDGWRFVVGVGDDSGNQWPMVLPVAAS